MILAEAGITSWYSYYRENGLVRSPGGYPGEDLDVLAALTYSRNLQGADFLAHNTQYEAHLSQMLESLERSTGDYNQYWHDRNYLPQAKNTKADVLIVHGYKTGMLHQIKPIIFGKLCQKKRLSTPSYTAAPIFI